MGNSLTRRETISFSRIAEKLLASQGPCSMKFAGWLVGWLGGESVIRGTYKGTISHFDIPNR